MTRASSPARKPASTSPSQAAPLGLAAERRRSRSERRATERLPIRIAVRQEVVDGETEPQGHRFLLAQSSDLGLGGMRIWRSISETEPELPANTEVELAFELPGTTDLLTVRGEVVFDETEGEGGRYRRTGVRFRDLGAHEQALLTDFLTRVPPLET